MLAGPLPPGASRATTPAVPPDQGVPTLTEYELPAISPLEFVVDEHGDGTPTIDVREGEYEQGYNLRNPYSCTLFVALCRRDGLVIYRRPRQRSSTVCVKTTASRHRVVWEQFLVLSDQLERNLAQMTEQFVHEEVESHPR